MKISNDIKLDFDDVLLVPQRSTLDSRKDVSLERTFKFYHSRRELTLVPIFCANMTSVATFNMAKSLSKFKMVTCLHKYYSLDQLISYFEETNDYNYTWVSIGKSESDLNKILELSYHLKYQPNIVIDVPNGYMESFVDFCAHVRSKFDQSIIMGGNICTLSMAQELILHGGIDIAKIQIGPGKLCRTRVVTGVGYPSLSCIQDCSAIHGLKSEEKRLGLICSDGGCKHPGDLAKAFAANADFVMIGTMLTGTEECDPQDFVEKDGKRYQRVYGMSSHLAQEKHGQGIKSYRASEGAVMDIPYKGSVVNVIQEILGGIRSACSYIGANSIKDMGKCAEFVRTNRLHQDF